MKKDILRKLSDENNGYLFTAEVLSHKISKTYLSKFVKESWNLCSAGYLAG